MNEEAFNEAREIINSSNIDEKTDFNWLLDRTETFCQDKAIYNSIVLATKILDGKDKIYNKDAIPDLLQKALSVSFDKHIGHDYIEDADKAFAYYHSREVHIPFNLNYFNRITKGGLFRKTLNCVMALTGVGKSALLGHCAAHHLMDGYNVLYITLEMSELEIRKRIDANLLDCTMDELELLSEQSYKKRFNRIKEKVKGKLIIHEYATGSAGAAQFRFLLNELKIKKNFVPDVIYVDYLNICRSSTVKRAVGMYEYGKAVAEEIRGLAIEFNAAVFTATQINREGKKSSEVDMENVAESWGLPMTCDLLFALQSSDDLSSLNQILVKQLKSRYNNIDLDRKFVIGFDKFRMRFFDVDNPTQGLISDVHYDSNTGEVLDDKPVFDNSAVHEAVAREITYNKVTQLLEGFE